MTRRLDAMYDQMAQMNIKLDQTNEGIAQLNTKLDTKLDATNAELSHLWPEFLPDGKHYLYHVRSAGWAEFRIYAGSLGSSQRTLLLKGVTNARYAPPRGGYPGYLLYVRDDTLMAQSFDDRRLTLSSPRENNPASQNAQEFV